MKLNSPLIGLFPHRVAGGRLQSRAHGAAHRRARGREQVSSLRPLSVARAQRTRHVSVPREQERPACLA